MKITLIIFLSIIIVSVIALFILAKRSASGDAAGSVDGKLARCPDTPNCVCSEFADDSSHFIEPLRIEGVMDMAFVLSTVKQMGATIHSHTDHYLSATFTSTLFGFVDDFEVRLDPAQSILHFRSASRVGRGDMGVNRKRVELLNRLLHEPQ